MRFVKILIIAMFISTMAQGASMKETILINNAGGGICKVCAEEVGGDVEAFSNMNAQIMKLAEKMGYTSNLQSYLSDVYKAQGILGKQLEKNYGSKLNIYNKWCIKFYNGYQNGLAKAYK